MIKINEIFHSIQGESSFAGLPCVFVRLTNCNLRCTYCDTEYAFYEGKVYSVEQIVKEVKNYNCKLIEVTGGEPLTWDMTQLTTQLKAKGLQIHIETSGAYKLTGTWDWICLSPKKLKLPTEEIYELANELKMIVYNKDDFRFAEEQASKVNKDCILYLQPEWSRRDKMIPEIVDYVMANPKWKVSLQTHKYLNIP